MLVDPICRERSVTARRRREHMSTAHVLRGIAFYLDEVVSRPNARAGRDASNDMSTSGFRLSQTLSRVQAGEA